MSLEQLKVPVCIPEGIHTRKYKQRFLFGIGESGGSVF
jgi:hypothetical protein